MAENKEFNYAEAMAEVEQILGEMSTERISIDELEKKVRRASELIKACHARLNKVEASVEELLKEDEA